MKTNISNIADIQTGVFAKPELKGDIVYLQAKHFDEYGRLHSILHPDIKGNNVSPKHLLRNGDVLFAAKGSKNFATVFEEHNVPAVASTSFFVLRLKGKDIKPEFVAWTLNQPSSQTYLKSKAKGSSILSISKLALEELEINVPTLAKQQKILYISKLSLVELDLMDQIKQMRKLLIEQKIFKTLNNKL